MKFSYNLIRKYVDTKLTPDKLAEILTAKTAEVESIERAGDDHIMEIKILYNRGDLLSHYGMAREISVLTGASLGKLDLDYKEAKEKTSDLLKVEIKNSELCPRYTAQIIKNVKVGDSPGWLKDTLTSLGFKLINNIVDTANYVMLETGQPLHAFDYDKIADHKIIVRNAKEGEKITTLDEARTSYELDPEMLIIADQEKPLAIAGIKGGYGSEIGGLTHTIALESANFERTNIRRTSGKLGLRSDASIRFSYGLDPNLAGHAIHRTAKLIQELAGGEITGGQVDVYPREVKPWKIAVTKSYISSLIGADISEKEIQNILARICQPIQSKGDKLILTVPTYRLDLQTPEDVIEEVARIYGYENIKPLPPVVSAYHPHDTDRTDAWEEAEHMKARELMRDIFKSLGFVETYNYSFISDETKEIFDIGDAPELSNPASHYYHYMRSDLIPNLMIAAQRNTRFYKDIRLFETGNAFSQEGAEIKEREQIAGVIVTRGEAFSELKGCLESFLEQLGIDDFELVPIADIETYAGKHWYHPGRAATIKISGEIVGIMGILNPKIAGRLDFKDGSETAQFSFRMSSLVKALDAELEYESIPKYPSVVRDISLLVNKNIRIERILNTISQADKTGIVRDIDIFDIYEPGVDEQKESGRKSVAFHLILRSDDHTLTDDEANKTESSIKEALKHALSAEIR